MKITATYAALIALAATGVEAQSYQTGLTDLVVAADSSRPLEGFVWYPTTAAEGPEEYHGNPVWTGITAAKDADLADGSFPLIVLSHGMYGNAMNQSWLASALAEQGYIVAAISHPGTSTWMRDPDHAREMWERPKDVSRVIDFLTDAPAFAAQVDADRIYMGGHSLGGFTAGLLAGARFDATQLDDICATAPNDLICGIFRGWNIAETPQDVAMMEADLSDPRISKIALFDLGGTQTFTAESLAAIEPNLLVIGAPSGVHDINLDLESRALGLQASGFGNPR